MRLEFAKIKGAKIVLHAKSSAFRAAKLKRFTVFHVNVHRGIILPHYLSRLTYLPTQMTLVSDISLTLRDVKKQLDKLRIDKAAGADGLSARLLAEVK